MLQIKLFITFFKIGLFSFGGGYAMLPLIQQEVVQNNQWITQATFSNLIGISQTTPGPIAINSATFIGFRTAGISGAFLATLGVITPSIIIISIFSTIISKLRGNTYLEAVMQILKLVAIGLIAAAALLLRTDVTNSYSSAIIFILVFFASFKLKVDPIILILLSGLAGFLFL